MEYLRAQKATTTNTTIVTITVAATVVVSVEIPTEVVTQPIANQPGSQSGPSEHVIAYPWEMPQNYTPQIASGSAFVLYQPMFVPTISGNSITYHRGMPTHISPQVIDADNHEIPQGQTRQNSVLVTVETLDDNEPEYSGPHIHFHIHPQATQPIVHNPYQVVQNVYPRMPNAYGSTIAYQRCILACPLRGPLCT